MDKKRLKRKNGKSGQFDLRGISESESASDSEEEEEKTIGKRNHEKKTKKENKYF